ncbi:MAG: acyl carrier protein [Prevotella sp.]|jgi:polyketide biosynthesis acyl carrier protein|nr:acyl carrier protein [Prevotella sp.]
MSKENIYEIVKKIIQEVLPDVKSENISIEKNLKELGANSIDRMEIVTLSMEKLDLKIPLMSFANVNNIEGLVDVLTANVEQL